MTTLAEYARRIVDAEARAAWSEAKRLRAEALAAPAVAAAAPTAGIKDAAAWEEEKSELARLRAVPIGCVLRHPRRGEVKVTCERVAEHAWRFAGVDYPSISAAAKAAKEALGLGARRDNGWRFWGVVDKRGHLYSKGGNK